MTADPNGRTSRCGRASTPRQELHALLLTGEHDALELSQAVHITEKEVLDHLDHLRKSLRNQGQELVVVPSECLGCGFVFEDRTRLSRAGRCPRCGKGRVTRPRFRVTGGR